MFAVPIVNTLLNPANENYKEYYLNDQNHFGMSTSLGNRITALIREDTVETDVSLLPFDEI